ncbi:helix-turn-helix domain-containing protein [Euzebya sp.]|uniref:helix-turn-helix domain-containing protein n=1 Tax=Euzebya sp. TaxID=1971409 RepID=UPI003515ACC0
MDVTGKSRERHARRVNLREAARHEVLEPVARVTSDGSTTTLLTAAQVAERWQVPVRTVYAWAKRNAMPHYRAGRLLRFDPAEVEEHFRSHGFADEVAADPERPGESAFTLLNA